MAQGGPRPDLHTQRIRAFVVVCEELARTSGHIEVAAPVGVGVDRDTGSIEPRIAIESVRVPVAQGMAVDGKAIIEGFARVKLAWVCPACEAEERQLVIPFEAILDCGCIQDADEVIVRSSVENTVVTGLPDSDSCPARLVLKVLVRLDVIVGRMQIICCCCRDDDHGDSGREADEVPDPQVHSPVHDPPRYPRWGRNARPWGPR